MIYLHGNKFLFISIEIGKIHLTDLITLKVFLIVYLNLLLKQHNYIQISKLEAVK